jgi:Cu+-exporting ATPase
MQAYLLSAKAAKAFIQITFVYSILYNIVGLSYALSAQLQPVVAAVLMPSSSISIILISYFGTKYIERKYLTAKN